MSAINVIMPEGLIHYWIHRCATGTVLPARTLDLLGSVRGKDATMQIATITTTGFAPAMTAAVAAPRTPDANRVLGDVRIRFFDRDDHVTFTAHQQLVAGGRVGAREGYATLREAMVELAFATRGDRVQAAAVLERDGRFYGHALKGRDLEQGVRAPLRRTYLEADDRMEVVEFRAKERLDRLRAIVDGAYSHRFRG
jgi:hypothetical protein